MGRRITLCFLVPLLFLSACQADIEQTATEDNSIQSVGLKLTQYIGDDPMTKTTYVTEGTGKFVWAAGDIVGIISGEGNQMMFPIKEQYYGQDLAMFDGRGFSLVSSSTYYSYYPFQADYHLDATAVPISYEGQVQSGDNSMAHLGDYSFTKAAGETPDSGTLIFQYQNVGSPHRYRMPVIAGTYIRFTLDVSSAKYILAGTINLTSDSITITPVQSDKEISLDLTNTTMTDGTQLRCWMMLPPADMSDETIRLTLLKSDGTEIVAVVAGRDCPANTRRVFNALTSAWPAVSETSAEGGNVTVKLIRSAESDAVTVTSDSAWLTQSSSATDGLVTTYTFTAAENTGAERLANISFAETSTGLTNRIQVRQLKAGSIIGIGGWDPENHQGNAD